MRFPRIAKPWLFVPLVGLALAVGCSESPVQQRANAAGATSGPISVAPTTSRPGGPPTEANAPGIPVLDGTIQTTPSGLKYLDEQVGTGAPVRAGQNVNVHYTGWLTNGQKFDSSRDRGQPFSFPLGQGRVIRGWDEGVATMLTGGKRRLIIPASLGYGAQGAGASIPPNSTLIFDVELISAS